MWLDGHQWLVDGGEGESFLTLCCVDFPQTIPCENRSHSRDQSDVSSSEDEELCIPAGANVHFNIYEGTPGLQIRTRCTSSWTPIASRTRSKSKV